MDTATQIDHLKQLFKSQKAAFNKSPFPDYRKRLNNLNKLKSLLLDNQQQFIEALNKDFGNRSADDSKIGDILTSVSGINYNISNLKRWMKPEKRHVSVLFQPAKARVEYQPLGVVGILVPWNYPVFLALGPLAAALAAGNRAIIKMSEFTPNTTALLTKLVTSHFDEDEVSVVGGEAEVASVFSSLTFDHIFFTGSTAVGKLVMKAAAENLVPVTLELGGKSPAIIDKKMSIKTAVERLILGKTLNSGQTCVAPDYILCPKGKVQELSDELANSFNKMFPGINENNDYTSVVNDGQYNRLINLIADAKAKGASVRELAINPECQKSRQLPLTLITNISNDMTVMQEEIFGPILPIIEYDTIEQAISYVNDRDRPLALYIYSFDKKLQQQIIKQTHAGGVCINDAAFHVAVDDLPFGGVGPSGMGSYHGEEGFKTFSHAKSILSRGKISFTPMLFPPYGTFIHNLVYKLFIR
ncbi:coniferyl aldehyde dehydrogenase [Thalassotalea psychrophila]|uniref:Aldehyde dehydrogenase n=1 Tax=Thalassotalea psychrophila TaxID=3065647 RepID=A0ABY9TZL2_9GAMM|nr:coniferyl aldehyde dehydrogenase [Colwelliaceae bacterium SQ149]